MKEGKPIWVESVLSPEEYKECAKRYPASYSNGNKAPEMFDCDFKWRHNMGNSMSMAVINTINNNLEKLRKLIINANIQNMVVEDGGKQENA